MTQATGKIAVIGTYMPSSEIFVQIATSPTYFGFAINNDAGKDASRRLNECAAMGWEVTVVGTGSVFDNEWEGVERIYVQPPV